jgi:hypothetical protein
MAYQNYAPQFQKGKNSWQLLQDQLSAQLPVKEK